uniref:G-protein coupled receptors family 1 profile domain-containing protein n=1 Tax=Onchocerca volvulus TaxID=6282 RepID=A0A8R1TKB4_ONCVO
MAIRSCSIIVLFSILFVICHEENVTNVFDIRDEQHMIIKYIAALLFIISLLYGIISNVLMAISLLCGGKDNHYKRAFVHITLHLIISNLMAFLPQIIVILPEILQTTSDSFAYETTWINRITSTFIIFPFFGVFHFSFLMTFYRFVVLVLPKYNACFETTRLYFLITFIWLSISAVTIGDFYYCTRKFLAWELIWEENCFELNAGLTWWRIRFFWTLFIPNAMFVLYIAMFFSIRRKRQGITKTRAVIRKNAKKTNHYERSMLIQAAWNCGIMEIGIISFNFLPSVLLEIFGESINIPSRIFNNCCLILICAVLPTIHFIYSKGARSIVKRHLYKWSYLKLNSMN